MGTEKKQRTVTTKREWPASWKLTAMRFKEWQSDVMWVSKAQKVNSLGEAWQDTWGPGPPPSCEWDGEHLHLRDGQGTGFPLGWGGSEPGGHFTRVKCCTLSTGVQWKDVVCMERMDNWDQQTGTRANWHSVVAVYKVITELTPAFLWWLRRSIRTQSLGPQASRSWALRLHVNSISLEVHKIATLHYFCPTKTTTSDGSG